MNISDDTLGRITDEVLTAMPHVAKAMHFRTTDGTWRRLGQVANGTDLLEHQLTVNEIMWDMVLDDITKTHHDYESRQGFADNAHEVALALQVIQGFMTKASLVIASRQTAIRSALQQVLIHYQTGPLDGLTAEA